MKSGYYITLSICFITLISCSEGKISEIEKLKEIEKIHLKSLVDAKMEIAQSLHAEDFQLVNPSGRTYTKEQYLGSIASGHLDYTVFEPESEIEVRINGKSAVLRYKSTIEITVGDQYYPPERFWHTDTYEYQYGKWQVVWSQETTIVE